MRPFNSVLVLSLLSVLGVTSCVSKGDTTLNVGARETTGVDTRDASAGEPTERTEGPHADGPGSTGSETDDGAPDVQLPSAPADTSDPEDGASEEPDPTDPENPSGNSEETETDGPSDPLSDDTEQTDDVDETDGTEPPTDGEEQTDGTEPQPTFDCSEPVSLSDPPQTEISASRKWAHWRVSNFGVADRFGILACNAQCCREVCPDCFDERCADSEAECECQQSGVQCVVHDRVTDLLWQREVRTETLRQNVARNYCNDLVLAGHDDWKLPTRIELSSLRDVTRQNPAIDLDVFSPLPTSEDARWFWTSSAFAGGAEAWVIRFSDGINDYHTTTSLHSVRCVR